MASVRQTKGMSGDQERRTLERLAAVEADFATAMRQMYAVGNQLARLRADIAQGSGTPGRAPARAVAGQGVSTVASRPGTGSVPPPTPAAQPPGGTGPTPPSTPPPGIAATSHPQPGMRVPLAPGTAATAPIPVPGPGAAARPSTEAIPPIPPRAGAPRPSMPPPTAGRPAPDAARPGGIPGQPSGIPSQPGGIPGQPAATPNALARWWATESLVTRILGIVGAVVTLAGLVMLLVLAIQQNWFGPVPRVIAGVVLAVVLIVLAHLVHARERKADRAAVGAVALAGTGYAAAFLDVVAVTSIYEWVPAWVGLILAALVTGLGLFVARSWNSQALAIFVLLGASGFAPIVADGATWVLSAFLVALVVASWPAQLGRNWPWVTAVRIVPPVFVILVTSALSQGRPEEPAAHAVLTTVLALAGLALATVEARGSGAAMSPVTYIGTAVPVLFALLPLEIPWRTVTVAIAAVAWLGYAALGESQKWLPRPLTISAAALGTLALLLAIVARSATAWIGTALLVAAALYVLVAAATRSTTALGCALTVTGIALMGYLRHPITVLVERTAVHSDLAVIVIDSFVTAGLVAALAWLAHRFTGPSLTTRRLIGALSWVSGLVVATTAVVSVGVLIGRALDDAVGGFRAGHAMATILWMVAAAGLLILGLRRTRDAVLALWLGLGLAATAVIKLFIYDLAALQGIWRVIAFIVVGLLLLGTGAGYAKALERARATQPSAPNPTP